MQSLIMLIVCIIAVSCTLGYILFSRVDKSKSNVFVGFDNANRCYVSQNLHDNHKVATFKGEHKRY